MTILEYTMCPYSLPLWLFWPYISMIQTVKFNQFKTNKNNIFHYRLNVYVCTLPLKSTVAQVRTSAKTTKLLARGKMTFAHYIHFENSIFNASAEGASAIFIGINRCFNNAFCVDIQTLSFALAWVTSQTNMRPLRCTQALWI